MRPTQLKLKELKNGNMSGGVEFLLWAVQESPPLLGEGSAEVRSNPSLGSGLEGEESEV